MVLPNPHHNSETLRGEIAYRREQLTKRRSSRFSIYGVMVVIPLLSAYWLIRLLIRRATGRSLPALAYGSTGAKDESLNCAGSDRSSSGAPLVRCSQCGRYVGLSNKRVLAHNR